MNKLIPVAFKGTLSQFSVFNLSIKLQPHELHVTPSRLKRMEFIISQDYSLWYSIMAQIDFGPITESVHNQPNVASLFRITMVSFRDGQLGN